MGNVSVQKTKLDGVCIIEPQIFRDARGFFIESYNKKDFLKAGITEDFVQDNHSKSQKGVLRGLHYQYPHPQAKLIRVIRGSVYDVAVDIRDRSPTYGKYIGVTLSAEVPRMLFIPVGFAHGFIVLEDNTEVMYKVTDFYFPEGDGGIIWNDPDIAITWPDIVNEPGHPILSEKDTKHPSLKNFRSPFMYTKRA